MSDEGKRIAAMAGQFHGGKLDPHYTGFFELFNQRKYFEAHEVLEHIWLKDRQGPDGAFHKGLIQARRGICHLQKGRPQPAASLLSSRWPIWKNIRRFNEHLNLKSVVVLIKKWLEELERTHLRINPLTAAVKAGENVEATGR